MTKRGYEKICPKCGRLAYVIKTWTRNKTNKKFSYMVYVHQDGLKHYIRADNGKKEQIESLSAYDLLISIIKKLDYGKEFRYTDLKTIAENIRGDKINNETFVRALKKIQIDGLLEKNINGSKITYTRRILPPAKYLTISRGDISLKILNDKMICQALFYVENTYEEPIDEFFIVGNIGINSLFKIDQISFINDKSGPIPFENVKPVVSYGENILVSIKLNSIIRKGETNYIFLIINLDKEVDHIRVRFWSFTKEINLLIYYDLSNSNNLKININKQHGFGTLEEVPAFRRKLNDKTVCLASALGNLEAPEGIYIALR